MCVAMLNNGAGFPLERLAVVAATLLGPTCLNVSHAITLAGLTNTTLEGGVDRIWYRVPGGV